MMPIRKVPGIFFTATLLAALGIGLGSGFSVRAAPAVYYVAINGNDAWTGQLPDPNAGNTDGPWRTIQHAVDTSPAGDTIQVRTGIYREWVLINNGISGTSSAPTTLAAYPGEQPVLDGAWYPTTWTQPDPSYPKIWFADASSQSFGSIGEARLVWQDDVPLKHADTATLTDGTWWYDASTKFLYVWMRGGVDPNHHVAVQALQDAFTLNAASWITLDGFHIVHYFRGIEQLDSSGSPTPATMEGLTVRNCDIEHVGEGIMLAGGDIGTYGITNNSLIENNTIQETQSDGIWVGTGTNHIVRGNTVSGVKQAWYRSFVSAGIILGNADTSVVERNQVSDVDALGIDVEHFNSGVYGNGNIVRRNLVHDVTQHAIAILGANTTQVENNIIYNAAVFGILVASEDGPAQDNRIVNNTIYHGADRGISIDAGPTHPDPGGPPPRTSLRNNIFDDIANVAIDNRGINTTADNDLFWQTVGGVAVWEGSTYTTLADFQATPQEANGVSGNPLFRSPGSDFRLMAGSPAIDAGSNAFAPSEDYFGTHRPLDGNLDGTATADIGAVEYDPGTTPTPTDTQPASPTSTDTPSETMTNTPSPVSTPSETVSATPTDSPTASGTSTITRTSTPAPSTTLTPTLTGSRTVTRTFTATLSPTLTRTLTRTRSSTPTRTRTRTPLKTFTRTITPTLSVVFSVTASPSPSASSSPTLSFSRTSTHTAVVTASDTRAPTLTPMETPSITATSPASGSAILGTSLSSLLRDPRLIFFIIAVVLIVSLAALIVLFLSRGLEQEGKSPKEK